MSGEHRRTIEDVLRLVCDYLNQNNIPYVIVGAIAVCVYGNPRATSDIDFVLLLEKEKLKEFAVFLRKNDFFSSPEDAEDALRERSHFTPIDKISLLRLDIKGVYSEMDRRAITSRRAITYHGTNLFLASPEDTIASKLWYGREKDIEDIEGIYVRQLHNLDMRYLETACAMLGVLGDLNKMRQKVKRYMEK
ncbi:MAG: hypothetical protein CVT47_00175 [Thermoplasmata archaeon HGW-Thermoplasmata-2]|nr:MAG: hypothetical protein CVT47_00175 [Thermoplasmata archaeon HGW-Thermoplasmata-2]